MNGVSIIETATLEALIAKVEAIQDFVTKSAENTNPYMSIDEVSKMTGFTKVWVINNKQDIGYSNVGRAVRFKRKDVEAYMDAGYFKKSQRRKSR